MYGLVCADSVEWQMNKKLGSRDFMAMYFAQQRQNKDWKLDWRKEVEFDFRPMGDAFFILWYSSQLRAIFTESGGTVKINKKSKICFLFFESAFKMMSRSKEIK